MGWVGCVEEIHVETQVIGRVGYVLRFGFGADVPCTAVEGVFESADAGGNGDDGFLGLGYVFDKEEAISVQVGEGFEEGFVLGHVRVVIDPFVVFYDPVLIPENSIVVSHSTA